MGTRLLERLRESRRRYGASVSEDGRYLVIATWKGTDRKGRITYKDLAEPYGLPVDLIDHFENALVMQFLQESFDFGAPERAAEPRLQQLAPDDDLVAGRESAGEFRERPGSTRGDDVQHGDCGLAC